MCLPKINRCTQTCCSLLVAATVTVRLFFRVWRLQLRHGMTSHLKTAKRAMPTLRKIAIYRVSQKSSCSTPMIGEFLTLQIKTPSLPQPVEKKPPCPSLAPIVPSPMFTMLVFCSNLECYWGRCWSDTANSIRNCIVICHCNFFSNSLKKIRILWKEGVPNIITYIYVQTLIFWTLLWTLCTSCE